ncbi:bifunctional DNA-binding transcriptional regulator/O6-methylguanine-DNA methyltransferase Ada [Rhodoblastus sp.]|uniref:bifunctional DNA-binding transcriptional regulator/O6-methylguanine-DNA methyltransferase Ada n=1 Tax=Rhodoblastus sp. TaxID=1962975 RepID=UPI002638013D|nr:bifunctional DNA-binding transcriptional regulator/O6-methylguanine-DNA methyltransferase Ada [Rhodoblastus sp.]
MNPDLKSIEDQRRWARVLARDASADGAYVYAVASTGVYCRPSCPARIAKPENVRFYASPGEAEAAGYRACKRCNPAGLSRAQAKAAIVARACRLIETAESMPSLAELSAACGLSPPHLHRQFRAITGVTPKAYAMARRVEAVRVRLADPETSVISAIYGAGFNASSRFYETSQASLGMSPTALKRGGRGVAIRFAVGQSSLGAVLVAMSAKGVCAISLGDDPETLVRDLQERFPAAQLIGADDAFEALVARVIGFVDAPQIGLDLPLDLRGTAFQQRVWRALQKVPAGETLSYSELADRLDLPNGARAVARACAANTIAVAIPCHRVVRNDGALSGYRWGVERKQALLDKEAASRPGRK